MQHKTFRWPTVKSFFKKKMGTEVKHVYLFKDDAGNWTGSGLVEFESASVAEEAIKKMNQFEFKGRKIVVKVSTL